MLGWEVLLMADDDLIKVEPTYYPAPPQGKRIAAFIIDALIAAVPMTLSGIIMLMPFIWMMTVRPLPSFYNDEILYYLVASIFLISIPWFIFYSLCRDGFRGRSLGKRAFGLIVITTDQGKPCPMGKSMLRNLLMVLIALFHWFIPLFGFLGLLVEPVAILTNPNGLRFGDRWAETQVVEAELVRYKPERS
jgi:uncharacterized RDD family membrane protein YckC